MARHSAPHLFRLGTAVAAALGVIALQVSAQPAGPAPAAATPAAEAAAPARDPRGPSPDGYYWVEVEVTIFSSAYGSAPYSEVPVANSNSLRYLPQLRLLANPADAYAFPFAPPPPAEAAPVPAPPVDAFGTVPVPAPVLEGPRYSPAVAGAFKLLDIERDPYVALDRRYWRFNQLNSRLQSGAEHAVLWHQVWRQPLRPRAQTPALQIIGGDAFGPHNALEGSLRLSSQGQGVVADLDANLWLTTFANQMPVTTDGEWKLPDQPVLKEPANATAESIQQDVTLVPAVSWYPTSIWQLDQSRDVGPNALYYLDHPAMGLLIEIRPYLVPEMVVPVADAASAAAATQFE